MAEFEASEVEEEDFGIVIAKGQDWVEVRVGRTRCEKTKAHIERVAIGNLEF